MLDAPRRFIRVLKPVRVAAGAAYGELRPYARGLRVETEIEFDHPLIGRQTLAFDCTPEVFRHDIARARTFGFMRDVAKLYRAVTFLFRRDAFVVGMGAMLALDLRTWAFSILLVGVLILPPLLVIHYVVMAHRAKKA